MSFSPEKPIDVTVPSIEDRMHYVYKATAQLLEAALTEKPHAGAIIRGVMRGRELRDYRELVHRGKPISSLNAMDWVAPIDHAQQEWWDRRSYATGHVFSPLCYSSAPTLNRDWHTDQHVELDDLPELGLTVSVPVQGRSAYYLRPLNLNPFLPNNTTAINQLSDARIVVEPPDGPPTLQAEPGDIVIWTEIPPTEHGVRVSTDRKAALYSNNLVVRWLADRQRKVEPWRNSVSM